MNPDSGKQAISFDTDHNGKESGNDGALFFYYHCS